MRETVLHSLKWVAFGKAIGQSVRWVTTIFTLQFLFPEDYAVIALSTFFMALSWSFSRGGIAPALIREKNIDDHLVGEFFTLSIIAHFLLFILLQILAEPLATFYGDARLEDVIRVTSLTFIISLIGFIPSTLLNREMLFKKLAMVDAIAESIGALATVTLAWLGYGYWSIVFGVVLTEILKQVGYLFRSPSWIWPKKFTERIKNTYEFAWRAATQSALGYIIFNVDVAIAGVFLSITELGIYQFAVVLAMMPAAKVLPMLRQIALPVYAKIQDEPASLEWYFLKTQRISALIFVPVFWGMGGTAFVLIPTVFGAKWSDAAMVIAVYCISMPIKSLQQLFSPLMKATGHMKVVLSNTLLYGLILIPSFFVGAQFGGVGIAISWLAAFGFAFFLATYRSCRALNISFRHYLGSIYKVHLYGGVMAVACLLIGHYIDLVHPLITLAIQVIAGALIYLGLIWIFSRGYLKELVEMFRGKIAKT